MRFRLISGKYAEDGKLYSKGSIIASSKDLTKLYGEEKFERIHEKKQIEKPKPAANKPKRDGKVMKYKKAEKKK